MSPTTKLPFLTMILMISFASVNAVLFTPALPDIVHFFNISTHQGQQTIIWFLIAYTFGQLLYGPLAHRYGRKPTLYVGISIQIMSSFLCVLAGAIHEYSLMVIGRFFLGLGSGVGLKMVFTLVNEAYPPAEAHKKISYLMTAFAITPALGIALGGVLNTHFTWVSCFYAEALYGGILGFLVYRLPKFNEVLDKDALQANKLIEGYGAQFKNVSLMTGGFLMGSTTAFVYAFSALAPFIAIKLLGMSSTEYGFANLLPACGLVLGLVYSAELSHKIVLQKIIYRGIFIAVMGTLAMLAAILLKLPPLYAVFVPMTLIYFGLSLLLSNASTLAMSNTENKAHGSAVMNFVNMGVATLTVLSLGLFHVITLLLPIVFLVLCITQIIVYVFSIRKTQST
jgi:DHA1 family bicyclomycin/chloramphenicol resistance-like MFS transporter